MKKLLTVCFCCIVLLLSFSIVTHMVNLNAEPNPNVEHSMENNQGISFDNAKVSGKVFASYDRGYKTVEELLEVTTLIVRATPIAVEYESEVAICWVLRVEKSNKEDVEVIRLRQLKDEHLLKIDKEVVLALQEDSDEGYYNIPGGGCGLFRMDEGTNAVSGLLLESLKEQVSNSYSFAGADLTLSDVFYILSGMSAADRNP